jgi:hypothetical protein
VTDAPNLYQRARSDVAGILGYDLDALSPDQSMRVDVASALRVLLDTQSGRLVRGESLDARELLMASEALSRLLPPLREPAAGPREDPRQVMWEIYKQMRERGEIDLRSDEGWYQARIATLEAEIIALGGHPSAPEPGVSQHRGEAENRISGHLCGSITPPTCDITPPNEIGECFSGQKPGPDDPPPRSTRIIEAVPNPPAASAAPKYDYDKEQGWKDFVLPDGNISPTPMSGGRRWWGPV